MPFSRLPLDSLRHQLSFSCSSGQNDGISLTWAACIAVTVADSHSTEPASGTNCLEKREWKKTEDFSFLLLTTEDTSPYMCDQKNRFFFPVLATGTAAASNGVYFWGTIKRKKRQKTIPNNQGLILYTFSGPLGLIPPLHFFPPRKIEFLSGLFPVPQLLQSMGPKVMKWNYQAGKGLGCRQLFGEKRMIMVWGHHKGLGCYDNVFVYFEGMFLDLYHTLLLLQEEIANAQLSYFLFCIFITIRKESSWCLKASVFKFVFFGRDKKLGNEICLWILKTFAKLILLK